MCPHTTGATEPAIRWVLPEGGRDSAASLDMATSAGMTKGLHMGDFKSVLRGAAVALIKKKKRCVTVAVAENV